MSNFTFSILTKAIDALRNYGIITPGDAYEMKQRLKDMYTILKEENEND